MPDGEIRPSRALGNKVKLAFQAHPSVGCIGVAPPIQQAISSGPMRQYGGNLDYNRIDEGATVYLPVFVRGAFLWWAMATLASATVNFSAKAPKHPWIYSSP